MTLRDRFSHGAKVTKWKVGQQRRLRKIRDQIGGIEKNISKHKTNLVEMVFDLHAIKSSKSLSATSQSFTFTSLLTDIF